MKIEVYCLANNEELLMPYFMRHYNQFAKVILLESCSKDRTIEIAESMGAEVRSFDKPDEINDLWFTELKNTVWKDSTADWVMIVDADEFIYHPDIVSLLEQTEYTALLPAFYNMYSDVFPTAEGQIYDEVKYGRRWGGEANIYGKINIIKLPDITDTNYSPGCHRANLRGNVNIGVTSDIKTLHMRNLSREFTVNRVMSHARRMGEYNKKMGWGAHVFKSKEEIIAQMEEEMRDLIKVL